MFRWLGSWCFRNRRATAAIWVGFAVLVLAMAASAGAAFQATPTIPNAESIEGFDVIDERFGGLGSGAQGTIVFGTDAGVDDADVRAAMEEFFAEAAAIDEILTLVSPYDPAGAGQISQVGDRAGNVAFAVVGLGRGIGPGDGAEIAVELRKLFPAIEGLQIELGGEALAEFEPPESELIGLAFAIFVLIVAFGSVMAMGLPIGVAVAGVSTGIGLITLLSHTREMPSFAPQLGAMIGLGVGIDYALFIVTRYREALDDGLSPHDATVQAMDTAGRAVLFAGATVVLSLLGMLVIGLPFVSGLGIAAAITVVVTMAAGLTLLPALLGFVQHRVEVTRARGLVTAGFVALGLFGLGLGFRPLLLAFPLALFVLVVGGRVPSLNQVLDAPEKKPMRETGWYRWSRVVQRHPWIAAAAGVGLLLFLSLPLLDLHLGVADEGTYSEETTTRRAYDLLADGFGVGFNGPILITAELAAGGSPEDFAALAGILADDPGIAAASPPFPDDPANPQAALIRLIPTTAPQDRATDGLVERLRGTVIPPVVEQTGLDVNVTGTVAINRDFSDYLAGRTLLFLAAVLAVSFLLLMMVFRSLLVPLKAVIMNMLSIGAAYGLLVAVFQWGWLSWLGFGDGAPIEPFMPMMLFAVVFGLSMDYEVFLLSRMKEEYDRTGDAVNSVADGLALTARVITAAAAIMVFVFGSFVLEDGRVVQAFGFGLASAVFLDATIVRMLLVPATMELLGDKNWWLPGWLDRLLPSLNVEGEHHGPEHRQK